MRRFLKKSLMACATLALSALFTLGAKSVQADAQDGFNLRLDNAGQWHYYTDCFHVLPCRSDNMLPMHL